jgi:hypothetical protein
MMRERSEGDEVLGDDEVFPFGMHPPRPLSGGVGRGRAAIADKQ